MSRPYRATYFERNDSGKIKQKTTFYDDFLKLLDFLFDAEQLLDTDMHVTIWDQDGEKMYDDHIGCIRQGGPAIVARIPSNWVPSVTLRRREAQAMIDDQINGKLPVYGKLFDGDYLQHTEHDERVYRPVGLPAQLNDPVTIEFKRPVLYGYRYNRYTVMERSDVVFDETKQHVIVPNELVREETHPKVFWVSSCHSYQTAETPQKHLVCVWVD